MRIGVISDTHTPATGKEPPYQIAKAFEGTDMILHAGDIYVASCLDWLEQIAPVTAVEFQGLHHLKGDPRVAEQRTIEIEGFTIGMVHDLMIPGVKQEIRTGIIDSQFPAQESLPDAVAEAFGVPVQIVVFGHTHDSIIEDRQGILFVNPGSPTLPRQLRKLGTVAILEITREGRSAHLISLDQLT